MKLERLNREVGAGIHPSSLLPLTLFPAVLRLAAMSAFPLRPAVRLHPSAFFLMAVGCLGVAGQLVLLRELMATYGGNEFSAGVTVAVWILCEALGAWLASAAPLRQRAGRPRFLSLSSLLPVLSILFSLAAVPAAILVRPLLAVLPGETLSIPLLLLATFAVVFLPAASHGALFVTAAAAHAQSTPSRSTGVGSAYVWEGVGTVLTGLIFFALLNRLPSLAVIALLSIPLAAALFKSPVSGPSPLAALLLTAIAILAFIFAPPAERIAWRAAWHGQRVAAVANSPYGKIVRLERAGQQLILYDGLPVLTVPATEVEHVEELALLPVLYHPAPRRVLVLGSDVAIPVALARFRPDVEVMTVQLDPVLARTCLATLSPDTSLLPPLFSLTVADPISFLSNTLVTFDCIILTDAAPISLGSSRLFAAEFYRLCRLRLAPGGILATTGPGNPTSLSPDLEVIMTTRLQTLGTAFEHVLPLAADFPMLLASARPLDVATETVLLRLNRLAHKPNLLDPSYARSLLDPFRQEALSSALAGNSPAHRSELFPHPSPFGVSTSAFPRELFLNMVRENRLASPGFGAFYARLGNIPSRLLLLLGAVLLVFGLVGARWRGQRLASAAPVGQHSRGFAILTSGFSGAAVSSLLVFAWQVRFGSVFSGITLLVATFMLGTVLGGILGNRRSPLHPFLWADLVLVACTAAVVGLIRGGPAGVFLVANCLAGACLGFQFVVAGSGAAGSSAARRAGVLTALDLAGGSLGGILTALVLVPVFGMGPAALSAGAVKLTSALVQLTPKRRPSRS